MKRSAIFINVSRGQVVNEDDLYEALIEKDIAGAGLDVFAEEPVQQDHPLANLPQVTALPHIGSATVETREAMMRLCAENIALVLGGSRQRPRFDVSSGRPDGSEDFLAKIFLNI